MPLTKKKNNYYRSTVDYPARFTSYWTGGNKQINSDDNETTIFSYKELSRRKFD